MTISFFKFGTLTNFVVICVESLKFDGGEGVDYMCTFKRVDLVCRVATFTPSTSTPAGKVTCQDLI